jgi:hypothetical protein
MINMNDFAREIAEEEGGLEEVNIAQIKEIIKLTLEKVSRLGTARALELLERYR